MALPFEVPFAEVRANLDTFVDEVFLSLASEFMTLPKGPGFIEYPVFEQGLRGIEANDAQFPGVGAGRSAGNHPRSADRLYRATNDARLQPARMGLCHRAARRDLGAAGGGPEP